MEIQLAFDYRKDDIEQLFNCEELVRHVLQSEHIPDNCEVSVSFVSDEAIHELNRRWRGIDSPTDVLSFECDGIETFSQETSIHEETVELGDVIIAPDVAERQAPEFGLSFADEMSLLLTHGLLHLCGYDHLDDTEAARMEARESEILSTFWNRSFVRSMGDTL